MRLILGIDESGYGPRVGPLVVASCTLRAPADVVAVGDSLWAQLGGAIRPTKALHKSEESPPEVFVGDSKLLFVERWPLELERSALAILRWLGLEAGGPADVLSVVRGELDATPKWMDEALGQFPLCEQRATRGLSSSTVELVDISTHVLSARQFNAFVERTDNKADVNWALVAMLIQRTVEMATEPVEIVVDRQGGRVHYEALLEQLFECDVSIIEKTRKRSAYEVARPDVRSIEFLVSGDERCAAIAMASIIAKYTRELLMARLNGYFCSKIANLEPTEGYYRDGNRFIAETARLRRKLGIPENYFIRSR